MNDNSKLSLTDRIKSCFVVTGYGERFDLDNRRVCDLDDVYDTIKNLMDCMNIACYRTDKIRNSGAFDTPMYKHLIDDDLVIVNITTLNPNAMYELGVRYALKPRYTILIGQEGTKIPANINHIKVYSYKQDPNGMTHNQIIELRDKLKNVIITLNNSMENDSPVYNYLKGLKVTYTSSNSFKNKSLTVDLNEAERLYESGNFSEAEEKYRELLNYTNDAYILGRLSVCIYKQNENDISSLLKAKESIDMNINIDSETDPIILAKYASIMKKLWLKSNNSDYIFISKKYFETAYSIGNLYYAGVNLAFVQLCCAKVSSKFDKEQYIFLSNITYKKVKEQCEKLILSGHDDYWIHSTLAECAYALDDEKYITYYNKLKERDKFWKIKSLDAQIENLKELKTELNIQSNH